MYYTVHCYIGIVHFKTYVLRQEQGKRKYTRQAKSAKATGFYLRSNQSKTKLHSREGIYVESCYFLNAGLPFIIFKRKENIYKITTIFIFSSTLVNQYSFCYLFKLILYSNKLTISLN